MILKTPYLCARLFLNTVPEIDKLVKSLAISTPTLSARILWNRE